MLVAGTTLWLMLAASSVAAVVWLSRTSPREVARRLGDAPRAIRECPRLAYAAGAGIGTVTAALVLAGAAFVLSL